ncbi:rap1 GTPase-GDP dissociation stimulator 1-A [Conger conger]|uniref:rap1 GTPase-GDP dissociation stimulator 1-A n=1 Tax=Conger conger TaxID=82655 RepID=UPI002A5B0DE0|nr:rap1 GTPase-GDP dissociation stimulator 1-A [Conger conger]
MDPFNEALVAISVSTELIEEELQPHLDTLLTALEEGQEGAARQIADSWILPSLAHILRRNTLQLKALMIVYELAGEATARGRCMEAGLGIALLSLLSSTDQDLLLHTCRAISRICYDNNLLQDQLVRNGAIAPLAAILKKYPRNKALMSACLLALCSLADMGEEESSRLTWEELGHVSEGEVAYRGTHRHSLGFSSKVTVVRLNQRSGNQHTVTVEVVHRCSRALWGAHIARQTARQFRPTPFQVCHRFCQIIKNRVRNLPKTRSLKARLFHTFL